MNLRLPYFTPCPLIYHRITVLTRFPPLSPWADTVQYHGEIYCWFDAAITESYFMEMLQMI